MAEALEERNRKLARSRTLSRNPAYGGRFVLAYLLVALVFGGVIGLFAYLSSRTQSQPWSAYEPPGQGLVRAQNIANHVGPRYREGGQTIAAVDAQPPIVSTTLVDAVAIARPPSSGGVGGGYEQVEPADGLVMYVFCGSGQRCSVPESLDPVTSILRGRLLRRESLELALYTFKYMSDVQGVVALLPPIPRQNAASFQNTALYFKRNTVSDLLQKPLYQALPGRGPFEAASLPTATTTDLLTSRQFFRSEFQQLPNGRALLVLTKLK